MSMMRCSRCENDIDTDEEDFDFDNELCEECWIEVKSQEHRDRREEE